MDKYVSPPLFLFAKAPVAGLVKTRMQSELGADSCAALAEKMLYDSVEKIAHNWPGQFILSVSPDEKHRVFQDLANRYQLPLLPQIEGNLGERMQSVLQHGIRQCSAAAVMGCDVPHIDADIIVQAGNKLIAGEQTIGPAQDGGFYFLGLTEFPKDLFGNIKWGQSAVRADLQKNAKKAHLVFTELKLLRDIDRYSDLQWLAKIDKAYDKFL